MVRVTELLGNGIGPELRESVRTIAAVLPVNFEFEEFDLSLPNRNRRGPSVYDEVLESIDRTHVAIKYPTVTSGLSPNAVLRQRCDFSVIYRPVISIPGIETHFRENLDLHIVRVATGGTYEHGGGLVNRDVAVSLRIVDRRPCQQAAHFGFRLARQLNTHVTSASKHTIQRVTDGLFEEVVDETKKEYPDVSHRVELFDALLGKIVLNPQDYHVVVVLNEYGDFLSDMACGLVGSLGIGASVSYSFDADMNVISAMFDPAGGTAPDIAGQGKANPTAALLAFALLLDHIDRYELGHNLRLAVRELIADRRCTSDLGGKLSTADFTHEVIDRMTT